MEEHISQPFDSGRAAMKPYLIHAANARNELRLSALRYCYGSEGYGRYWALREMVLERVVYGSDDLDHPEKVAAELMCGVQEAQSFIRACIYDFELFTAEDFIRPPVGRLSRIRPTNAALWKAISRSVFRRDNYICRYCGQAGGNLEADHMLPLSRGGSNEPENLATSCRRCNRQKHSKTVEEFTARRLQT